MRKTKIESLNIRLTANFEAWRPVTLVDAQLVRNRAILELGQKVVGDEVLIAVRVAHEGVIALILIDGLEMLIIITTSND